MIYIFEDKLQQNLSRCLMYALVSRVKNLTVQSCPLDALAAKGEICLTENMCLFVESNSRICGTLDYLRECGVASDVTVFVDVIPDSAETVGVLRDILGKARDFKNLRIISLPSAEWLAICSAQSRAVGDVSLALSRGVHYKDKGIASIRAMHKKNFEKYCKFLMSYRFPECFAHWKPISRSYWGITCSKQYDDPVYYKRLLDKSMDLWKLLPLSEYLVNMVPIPADLYRGACKDIAQAYESQRELYVDYYRSKGKSEGYISKRCVAFPIGEVLAVLSD